VGATRKGDLAMRDRGGGGVEVAFLYTDPAVAGIKRRE
jgi:hypothetical protein